ncbi:hypothetical protein AR687_16590 [Flavobacteriaceae bacterium CRH]|nr:hypothetical protein AR687_16590 [Flavobacteriaceae bacterium CRH]
MLKLFLGSVFALIIFELILRFSFGFCDAPLVKVDDQIEYLYQPNQDRDRFGNHIIYNEFSMRSLPLNKKDSIVILGLGDSVINGGVSIDQNDLATDVLEKRLSNYYKKNIRFLNISAGSWGPENIFEYLKKFGSFNSKYFFLFVSSHDAHDNITHKKVVGISPNFPDKQYTFALAELTERYLLPRFKNLFSNSSVSSIDKKNEDDPIGKSQEFTTGFQNILKYCKQNKIELTVFLHLEKIEFLANKNNSQGDEIISFCKENNIPLINELGIPHQIDVYRDNIHLNEKGQKMIADTIFNYIKRVNFIEKGK